ncbi:MAG: hypothetical protein RJQ04_09365 [Longimicrobiales bacterium]
MQYEIERRYLVRVDAARTEALRGGGASLRQGYIRNGTPSVRIRTGEARGPVLTCKSGRGIRRREAESVVSAEVAEALFEAAGNRIIVKTRHRIGPWELDFFGGPLEGLTLLEIELDHEGDPVPGAPDGVSILREVTDDKSFVSGHLARLTPKEQRALVKAVYRKDRP